MKQDAGSKRPALQQKACSHGDVLPKVSLRPLEISDLDALYAIENDRELWRVGNTNMPYSRFLLEQYILSSTGDIYADKQLRLIITDEHHAIAGIIDLCNFQPKHLRAEVGLVINNDYRLKGYGKAALIQLIDYSRRVIHLHQLYALVDVDNSNCKNLFSHLGFQQGGILKDWLFDGQNYNDAMVLQLFL